MDEVLKTVKAQLYERISSPLLFSFVVSWALWNYRFVMILLSSLSVADKALAVDMLELRFSSGYEWAYWPTFGLIAPLFSALLYLFVYPIPAAGVYKYVRQKQRELKEIQTQIDDETPLSREESREIRAQFRAIARELEDLQTERQRLVSNQKEELTGLERELAELEQIVRARDTMIAELEQKLFDSRRSDGPATQAATELSALQVTVLRKIANAGEDRMFRSDLLVWIGGEKVEIDHALDELVALKMISLHSDGGGKESYKSTPLGRAYLVRKSNQATVVS